jgi:hypothetical protein
MYYGGQRSRGQTNWNDFGRREMRLFSWMASAALVVGRGNFDSSSFIGDWKSWWKFDRLLKIKNNSVIKIWRQRSNNLLRFVQLRRVSSGNRNTQYSNLYTAITTIKKQKHKSLKDI